MFNINRKTNPLERLSVEGRCIDCDLNEESRLGYKWRLSLLSENADEALDDSWQEQTDWEDKTTAGINSKSLVIEPGYLSAGRKYRLQLNAWKPGGEPGGYVIEELIMNVAPVGGRCEVPFIQGFALVTLFRVECAGWKDDDQPLNYLIGKSSFKQSQHCAVTRFFQQISNQLKRV